MTAANPNYTDFILAANKAKAERKSLCLDADGLFLVAATQESDPGGQPFCWSMDLGKKDMDVTREAFEAICVLGGFRSDA